jgi:thiol:disulfide interchange protein DsbA
MGMMKSAALALCLGLFAAGAGATIDNPQPGQEFRVLDLPQAVAPGAKIEVTEFFWYSCPHCNAFDPYLADWVKSRSDRIVFKRVPVGFRPGDEQQQALYYALETLGAAENMHSKVFHAIHVDHKHLNDESSIADFVASQGIDREAFLKAYRSFQVQTLVRRAQQMAQAYRIDQVPMLAVDGHFETAPSIAGSSLSSEADRDYFVATFKVLDWLLAKSAQAKK